MTLNKVQWLTIDVDRIAFVGINRWASWGRGDERARGERPV